MSLMGARAKEIVVIAVFSNALLPIISNPPGAIDTVERLVAFLKAFAELL